MLTYRRTLAASTLAVAVLTATACTPGTDAPGGGGGTGGKPAARGTALAAVDTLTVKGRAPKTGYEREKFGRAWVDVDGNGCGTRVISMLRRVIETFAQLMQGMVSCA
ncbi:HNH endonuclease family protein [Streptomyces tanashiensis]